MQPNTSLSPIEEECVELLRAKQYKSCEILASLELSRRSESHNTATLLELLGECCQETHQYKRAISFYRKAALQRLMGGVSSTSEAKLRWKEAQCLASLGSVIEASSVLEMVPRNLRTMGMSMTLGHLSVASGRQTDAIEAFLDSLRRNPYALEAVEWLAILDADRNAVLDAVEMGIQNRATEATEQENATNGTLVPIVDIVSAHYLMHRHQPTAALAQFEKLQQEFPRNVYLLLKIATLQLRLNDDASAEQTFAKVRLIDENNVECMDQYAQLFQRRGALAELNQLAADLLELDDKRPEAWVCLALYHEARHDHAKAMGTCSFGFVACWFWFATIALMLIVFRAYLLSTLVIHTHSLRGKGHCVGPAP